ncbi:MAG: metallophosphoesterase family protein [bacterium]
MKKLLKSLLFLFLNISFFSFISSMPAGKIDKVKLESVMNKYLKPVPVSPVSDETKKDETEDEQAGYSLRRSRSLDDPLWKISSDIDPGLDKYEGSSDIESEGSSESDGDFYNLEIPRDFATITQFDSYKELKKNCFFKGCERLRIIVDNILYYATDDLINRLVDFNLWFGESDKIGSITPELFNGSCGYIKKEFVSDDQNIIMIGDLHGNFKAFDAIITNLINEKILTNDLVLNNQYKIIVLGDFVDRGLNSLNIATVLMILSLINQDKVVVLRGNHEDKGQFSYYGFGAELERKLGQSFIDRFDTYFKLLPAAYFVKNSNGIFMFNHGGWQNMPENMNVFLSSDEVYLKINRLFLKRLMWNDINFDSNPSDSIEIGARGDDNLFEYPFQVALDQMNRFGIVAKFCGHMHLVPKGAPDYLTYSSYFKDTCGFAYIGNLINNIYVLMSGSIEVFDEQGNMKYSECINYFPSYLTLHLYTNKWIVDGCFKEDDSDFKYRTVPYYNKD